MKMELRYTITEEELYQLVKAVSDDTLGKLYAIDTIIDDILPKYMISKSEIVNIYFDDILNQLAPNDDIIKYINEVIKEWEL